MYVINVLTPLVLKLIISPITISTVECVFGATYIAVSEPQAIDICPKGKQALRDFDIDMRTVASSPQHTHSGRARRGPFPGALLLVKPAAIEGSLFHLIVVDDEAGLLHNPVSVPFQPRARKLWRTNHTLTTPLQLGQHGLFLCSYTCL